MSLDNENIGEMKLDNIETVIFDVDGTLYRKDIDLGKGTIQDSHDFFRFNAYAMLKAGNDKEDVKSFLIGTYKEIMKNGDIKEEIKDIPLKEEYIGKLKKWKSNGKTFINEFGTESTYLHSMLMHTDFASLIKKDDELIETMNYIKSKYNIGVLTTEVYQTCEKSFNALGLNIKDFYMNTGNGYKILCAENVKEKKPSPEGFQKLIGIYGNKNILYVGDHINKDVKAPLENGLKSIHVVTYGNNIEHKKIDNKPYIQVNNINNLRKLL